MYSEKTIRQLQLQDIDISSMLKWKEAGNRPFGTEICKTSMAIRHYWNLWNSMEIVNGVLYHRFFKRNGLSAYLQIVLPTKLHHEVLYQIIHRQFENCSWS